MAERPPKNAISMRKSQPAPHQHVIGYVSDRSVYIHHMPVIVWRDYADEWWAGLPGNYLDLRRLKWKITHWVPLDGANQQSTGEKA